MPKFISNEFVKIKSITKADGMPWEPGNWRNDHIGKCCRLTLLESLHAFPGERFGYMDFFAWVEDGDWCGSSPTAYYRTSLGVESRDGGETVIRTMNSVYTFEDLEGTLREGYIGAWGGFVRDFESRALGGENRQGE